MLKKILFHSLPLFILVVLEISFSSGLPWYFSNMNFLAVALIFVLVLLGFRPALLWAVVTGLIIDFYSFAPLSLNTIILPVVMAVCQFLLVNFLTNRSLYSILLLTLAATLFYDLLSIGGYQLLNIFLHNGIYTELRFDFWLNRLCGVGLNLALAALAFYLMNFASKRVKPVFLFSRTKPL